MEILIENSQVRLALTKVQDLDFVVMAEGDDENSDFVGQWPLDQHMQAISDEDVLHLVIKDAKNKSVGFVIIRGLLNSNDSIELMRIVVADKGKGYGRQVLKLVKRWCFEVQGAHRLWLDVLDHNVRAQHLYKSESFVCEGVLRESDKYEGVYHSQLIMSILKKEYQPE